MTSTPCRRHTSDPEPSAGPTEAGHHLVGDQEYAMPAAHLDDGGPIVVRRNGGGERRAGHGFRDERGDVGRPDLDDRPIELLGVPRAAPGRMVGIRAAVLVRGIDVPEPTQPRRVRRAEDLLAADVERSDRVAVVRGTPTDHRCPLVLAACQVVRTRELERRLDRLASAADRVDTRVVERQHRRDVVGVVLEGVGRERRPVDVRRPRCLFGHGVDERAVTVSDAHDDGAAGRIEVTASPGILDPHAVGSHRTRQIARQHAREHVAHDVYTPSGSSCVRMRRSSSSVGRGVSPIDSETRGFQPVFSSTSSRVTPG